MGVFFDLGQILKLEEGKDEEEDGEGELGNNFGKKQLNEEGIWTFSETLIWIWGFFDFVSEF